MDPSSSSTLSSSTVLNFMVREDCYAKIQSFFSKPSMPWDSFKSLSQTFRILEEDMKRFDKLDSTDRNSIFLLKRLCDEFDSEVGEDVLNDSNKVEIIDKIHSIYASVELPETEHSFTPPSRTESPAISESDFERDLKEDIFSPRGTRSLPWAIKRTSIINLNSSSSTPLSSSPLSSSPENSSPFLTMLNSPPNTPETFSLLKDSPISKVKILPTHKQERKITDFFRNVIVQYFPVMIHASSDSCFYLMKEQIGQDFEGIFPEIAEKLYEQTPVHLDDRDRKLIIGVLKSVGLFFSHLNYALTKHPEKTTNATEGEILLNQLKTMHEEMHKKKELGSDLDNRLGQFISKLNQAVAITDSDKISLEKEEDFLINEINKKRHQIGKKTVLSNGLHKQKVFKLLRSYLNDLINEMNPDESHQSKFIRLYSYLFLVENLFSPYAFSVIIDRILVDGLCFEDANVEKNHLQTTKGMKQGDDLFAKELGAEIYAILNELMGLGAPAGATHLLAKSLQTFVYYKSDKIGARAAENLSEILATPTLIRPIILLDQLLFKDVGSVRVPSLLEFFAMRDDKKKKFQAELEKRIDTKLYNFLLKTLNEKVSKNEKASKVSKAAVWTATQTSSLKAFCNTLSTHLYRLTQQPKLLQMLFIYIAEGILDSQNRRDSQDKK